MKTKRKGQRSGNRRAKRTVGAVTAEMILGNSAGKVKAPKVDPKWTWHYNYLTRRKKELLEDRSRRRADAGEQMETHSMDLADSATDEFNHDLSLAEISSRQEELYEIEDAIARILNGTYGICAATGEPIGAERLRAIPWTRFAKKAEERLESRGEVKRMQLGELGSVRSRLSGEMEESEAEEEKEESRAEDESLREVAVPETGKQPQAKEKKKPEKKTGVRRHVNPRAHERGRRRRVR